MKVHGSVGHGPPQVACYDLSGAWHGDSMERKMVDACVGMASLGGRESKVVNVWCTKYGTGTIVMGTLSRAQIR